MYERLSLKFVRGENEISAQKLSLFERRILYCPLVNVFTPLETERKSDKEVSMYPCMRNDNRLLPSGEL
jgi:hypothetical protein